MLSSRSLYEYYRQVDVGVGEEAPGVDVRSLDQSSACGVVLRMQENICTLSRDVTSDGDEGEPTWISALKKRAWLGGRDCTEKKPAGSEFL